MNSGHWIAPTSADFGKLSVGASVSRSFTLTRGDTLRTIVSLGGANPTEFFIRGPENSMHRGEADTLYGCWDERAGRSLPTCDVNVDFRPTALGIKAATLVVTDAHGQKATAALRGEAIVPVCKPVLVPCNWAIGYTGFIHIHQVDSVSNSDRKAKYETLVDINIDRGNVTCLGTRREFEQSLVDDKPVDELTFDGKINGTGMAAIEFQPDASNKMTYVLTYACATPAGNRVSKSLRFGTSETDKVLPEPADWSNSRMIGEPQPAIAAGMAPLIGKHTSTSWDPANKEGGYIKADWELKTP